MIDFIGESAGVRVLQELPANLSDISYAFEEENETPLEYDAFL